MSDRVFAHNDAQYGNLLRLREKRKDLPEHRQIIVVDFEYAATNPAAFDIANHFQEWTSNYHGPTPHLLDPSRFPTLDERANFIRSYLEHYFATSSRKAGKYKELERDVKRLEKQVQVWKAASHGMWAIWGIVQAREYLEASAKGDPAAEQLMEFDYIAYAICRMELFREDMKQLDLLES